MSLRTVLKFYFQEVPHCRHFSFQLSEKQRLLQQTCRHFADTELRPIAAQLDKEHKFPAEQIQQLGQLGLLSINVPVQYGGSGLDSLSVALAVEEIARGCGGTGSIVSIHNCLYTCLLSRLGTEDQKTEFLEPLTRGCLGCFALSEPGAGSDVSAIATTASLSGDCYVLNGTKSWVTNGPVGKAAVVFATVDKSLKHKGLTAFLVNLDNEGVTLGKKDEKLGVRASPTCNLILENVKIPRHNVLGKVGDGFGIAMDQLTYARMGIGAQALGIARAALELAVCYSKERKTFGQSISKFQAVQMRVADMSLKLESARLLVWRAAILCDQSRRSTKESSMAKVAASEAATFITHSTIQILGGVGYISGLPAERHYRDARVTEIYAGANDIQRLIIGQNVIREV